MTQSNDETGRKAVIGFAWELRTPLNSLEGHAELLSRYLEALKMQNVPSIQVGSLGNVEMSVDYALEMIHAIEETTRGLFTLVNETLGDQNDG